MFIIHLLLRDFDAGWAYYLERHRFHNGCSPLPEKLSAPAFSGSMPPQKNMKLLTPLPLLTSSPLPPYKKF